MSPFKSKAQLRKWGELVKQNKISKETFNEALKETPDVEKLPERTGPSGIDRIRKVAKAKLIK